MISPTAAAVIILIICTVCSISALSAGRAKRCTEPVTAKIVRLAEHGKTDKKTYQPVFSYQYQEKEYQVRSRGRFAEGIYQTGQFVRLTVNPHFPREYYNPDEPRSSLGRAIGFSAVVAFLSIFAGSMIKYNTKLRRKCRGLPTDDT